MEGPLGERFRVASPESTESKAETCPTPGSPIFEVESNKGNFSPLNKSTSSSTCTSGDYESLKIFDSSLLARISEWIENCRISDVSNELTSEEGSGEENEEGSGEESEEGSEEGSGGICEEICAEDCEDGNEEDDGGEKGEEGSKLKTNDETEHEFRMDTVLSTSPVAANFFCCVCGSPAGYDCFTCEDGDHCVCQLCQTELELAECPYVVEEENDDDELVGCGSLLRQFESEFREFMFENTIVACLYRQEGCEFEGPWEEVKEHQEVCEHSEK